MKNALNLLLLSGSQASGNLPHGQKPGFLDWAESWIRDFFVDSRKPILFVPYARPGGISERTYFDLTSQRMKKMGIETVCAPEQGVGDSDLENIGGIFVGGGHTPTLLYKLQSTGSLERIRKKAREGLKYMGSSAGSLIACPTIKSNNDMPCPSNDVMDLRSLGLISIQLNCHYIDNSMHDPKHQGETRDTRLIEFCAFNPGVSVLGLYEGQALRVIGDTLEIWTSESARGTQCPIFVNRERREISCQVGVPQQLVQ